MYAHANVNVISVRENGTWIQFPSWDLDYEIQAEVWLRLAAVGKT